MLNTLSSAALLGAVAVSANPLAYGPLNGWGGSPSNTWGSGASSTVSSYGASQTPFTFPLSNGFPNVSDATLRGIEVTAQGTLPNGPPVTHLNTTSITIFELIAFNEIFEVAFFSSLINNITSNYDGYGIGSSVLKDYVLKALDAVLAQEELHHLGANGILANAGQDKIQPCEYVFPTASFDDAIALARTFTDLVLGTLQDAQAGLNGDGDGEFIPLLGAVQGQEGEQNGFYRELINLIPSSAPFLTRSAAPFAFSALNQNFVVNGTCPGPANALLFKSLPIFGVLNVDTKNIALADQTLTFSVKTSSSYADVAGWSVTFINQQNVPVTKPITNIKLAGGVATFDAFFPAETLLMNALTISAVTHGASSFASVGDVAAATLFGPGLIEIN
ncbi:hypothetical protein LTR91_024138 [Friedmanniomyces endolithicus]|uniref:Late sexual development protein n=2 Tax=Dothideomycetidae TaxID=451867 RepID=A0A4U0USI2_9PEZI|nr:hypothetical protein LTS09_005635 [Friedmanniomyces endolithicus]KAK5142734.1 hypothetical protein LTR32_004985 [Rachicladosporium monterosium]KAK0365877.1 hypothetical protein LTR94_005299 [Friedmanniomyces endolithicus]KAK0779089.1 hypothetical protein LTR38_014566 [Friedmanniomyces endolithicus]KAK0797754.1 hypothetical protein LTR59_006662 [Friedmanniomyces endolithicus]